MNKYYQLKPNESVIRISEEIWFGNSIDDVAELMLTNLNIVVTTSKGVFRVVRSFKTFPIDQIKVIDGKIQTQVMFSDENGYYELRIHFNHGQEKFGYGVEEEALQWASTINVLVQAINPNNVAPIAQQTVPSSPMEYSYQLQPDEVVIREGLGAWHVNTGDYSEVILTNLNIVVVATTSEGKKRKKRVESGLQIFPINQIKVIDGKAQVQVKYSDEEEIYELEIYFLHGQEKFGYEVEEEALQWASTIDILLQVINLHNANPITQQAIPTPPAAPIAQQAVPNPPTVPNSNMPIEQQIEALKKLKDLLDAGILTEDEFNAKKKEIIGL